MDELMKQKLQQVLGRVKEPESGMSIAVLGLVNRIRYSEEKNTLQVVLNPTKPGKLCCAVLSGLLLNTTKGDLAAELSKEFPDLTVTYL